MKKSKNTEGTFTKIGAIATVIAATVAVIAAVDGTTVTGIDSNTTNDPATLPTEPGVIGYSQSGYNKLAKNSAIQKVFDKSKWIVLVPPFENVTGIRAEITIEAPTGSNRQARIKTRVVDKYTEAPRAILEDILSQFSNVIVVERQQLDKMLLESEYTRNSGLVDSQFALKIGKQLGANSIVTGTIISLREKNKSFKGYGISTNTKIITSTIRVRVVEINSGEVIFSKRIENSISYASSDFGGIKSSDTASEVIQSSLEKLQNDSQFINFFN